MTKPTDFGFIKLDELFNQPLEIDWLIDEFIPSESIGMIYGASGSGKSHIILSMAAMVANGLPWFDKNTKQGNVLVLAGEGLADIPQVACCLTRRSPKTERWTSDFCPERRLRSRRLLKQRGSGRETTVFWLGSDVFQHSGQTGRAAFVQIGRGSPSCT